MRITLCGLVAAALLVTGSGPTAAAPPSPAALEGTWWRLAELPASALAALHGETLLPGRMAKIGFEKGGVLTGADGCQPLQGSWSTTGGSINLKAETPLQRVCADIIMKQTAAFATALATATSYAIDGGKLVLVGASGDFVAKFAPVKMAPLEGTLWEALRINNGKGVGMSPIDGSTLTATFGAGGALTGNAGCNQFTGTFKTTGGKLTIPPPAATKKACPDPLMAQEREYFAALARVTKYAIDEDRLDLMDAAGARQIVLRAARQQAGEPAH